LKKSARIDRLKMRSMPVFRVKSNVSGDFQMYPGKIIQTDSVDAIGYVMMADPAYLSDLGLARQLLQEVWEEDQGEAPSQGT
jgi:hypothetical protein